MSFLNKIHELTEQTKELSKAITSNSTPEERALNLMIANTVLSLTYVLTIMNEKFDKLASSEYNSRLN